MDPRVARTRAAFCQAMEDLLMEKGIEKITVRELCERSGFSRAAFYGNYQDKYDLLSDAVRCAAASFGDYSEGAIEDRISFVLGRIESNKALRRSVAVRGMDREIRSALVDLFVEFAQDLAEKGLLRLRNPCMSFELAIVFVSYGLGGVVDAWVHGGCGRDKREVAREMMALVSGVFEIK